MEYMELQFPGDIQDARARSGRNISRPERWLSMAAGVGLAAYGPAGDVRPAGRSRGSARCSSGAA